MASYLLDVGNSRYKFAELVGNNIIKAASYEDIDFLSSLKAGDMLVFASVKINQRVQPIVEYCQNNNIASHQVFTEHQAFGITHSYKNPHNHGVDRWLAIVAAKSLTDEAFAVIDLGTANTLDVVTANGQHMGGWIAPGIALARDSVLQHTDRVFSHQQVAQQLFADNTPEALEAGCYQQLNGFVRQAIVTIKEHLGNTAAIFLTGGNSSLISSDLTAQVVPEPELVLKGLALYATRFQQSL